MNERLKELALQAGFETLPSKLKVSFGDNESTTSTWEYPHEKFAELIVRECVNICLNRHDTWRWDEDADSDSGPRDCARSIKQHFGVEE